MSGSDRALRELKGLIGRAHIPSTVYELSEARGAAEVICPPRVEGEVLDLGDDVDAMFFDDLVGMAEDEIKNTNKKPGCRAGTQREFLEARGRNPELGRDMVTIIIGDYVPSERRGNTERYMVYVDLPGFQRLFWAEGMVPFEEIRMPFEDRRDYLARIGVFIVRPVE